MWSKTENISTFPSRVQHSLSNGRRGREQVISFFQRIFRPVSVSRAVSGDQGIPAWTHYTGPGPCDLFGFSGRARTRVARFAARDEPTGTFQSPFWRTDCTNLDGWCLYGVGKFGRCPAACNFLPVNGRWNEGQTSDLQTDFGSCVLVSSFGTIQCH